MAIKLFKGILQNRSQKLAQMYSDLIRREAKIGGELFGPVKPGGRREFFCLDTHTWVWHEEWIDPETKKRRIVTTRYDVRPNGVLKAQDGQHYQMLTVQEARNFYNAVKMYRARVIDELYTGV